MKLENFKGRVNQNEVFVKRGFTLIELLAVIAIIAILASLSVAGMGKIRLNSQKKQAGLAIKLVDGAVEKFYADHNRLPNVGDYSADEEFSLEVGDADGEDLLKELLGEEGGSVNFKKKKYLIIQDAVNNVAGIDRGSDTFAQGLLDPWGGSYQVMLDYDYDGEIKIPADYVTLSGGATEVKGKRVLVWTTGKDVTAGTDDDAASWTNIR